MDSQEHNPPPASKDTTAPSHQFWKTFLQKMSISARLMGKEIYRNKLRWFDLRRADYRLLLLPGLAAAWLAYRHDKKRPEFGGWRTPESTLHLLDLPGG